MDIKRLIFVACCSFLTAACINYFFPSRVSNKEVQAGEFVAVTEHDYSAPLTSEVGLDQIPESASSMVSTVQSGQGTLQFSEHGGCLVGYSFDKASYAKKSIHGSSSLSIQYDALPGYEQHLLPFFVVGNVTTPAKFSLVSQEQTDQGTRLVYEAHNEHMRIVKEFMVHAKAYLIDFTLTLEPLDQELQARIYFPVPTSGSEEGRGSGFVMNSAQKFSRIDPASDAAQRVIVQPPLVGVQGAYLTSAVMQDASILVRRAYFMYAHDGRMVNVLETPVIDKKTSWNVRAYVGPRDYESLKAADQRLVHVLEYGWLARLSGLLLAALNWLYGFVRNYGLAIIILTFFIRLLLLPLSYLSRGGIAKREEFTRKYRYINERYKDDPERKALEQSELVKKYGVMPGGAGCLPVLLQLPLFIALQRGLRSSLTLYRESFTFWISDLSLPDPYFVLPICMGILFYIQVTQHLQAKQKVAALIGSVILVALFSHISAGLVLFIVSSTFFGLLQVRLLKVQ